MRIAVEGCTHGELEKTYETLKQIEEQDGRKVRIKLRFKFGVMDDYY